MVVVPWERPIGDIGENGLFDLLLLGCEKFFPFAEDSVNCLGRTSIQAEST